MILCLMLAWRGINDRAAMAAAAERAARSLRLQKEGSSSAAVKVR